MRIIPCSINPNVPPVIITYPALTTNADLCTPVILHVGIFAALYSGCKRVEGLAGKSEADQSREAIREGEQAEGGVIFESQPDL